MKIVRLAKVVEAAKDIKITGKTRKRQANKDIGFVIRSSFIGIDQFSADENIAISPRKRLNKINLPALSPAQLKGDSRFIKRDSMIATTDYHKLKSMKLHKRKVSFSDINNFFEYGVFSSHAAFMKANTINSNVDCLRLESKNNINHR